LIELSSEHILAVITLNMDQVGDGTPVFLARNEDEQEKIAGYLSRTLNAMVHDLGNGTYIVVRH